MRVKPNPWCTGLVFLLLLVLLLAADPSPEVWHGGNKTDALRFTD